MKIRLGGHGPVIVGFHYMYPGEERDVPAGLVDQLLGQGAPVTVVGATPASPEPTPGVPGLTWEDCGPLGKTSLVRLLAKHGYPTPAAVASATDAELLAIKGVGGKSLAALREILGRIGV